MQFIHTKNLKSNYFRKFISEVIAFFMELSHITIEKIIKESYNYKIGTYVLTYIKFTFNKSYLLI